jgi:Fur family ferric uptake transcriptional regulator
MSSKSSQQQNNLIADLKERGIRVTPQRAIILQTISSLPGHVTAEDIFTEVQKVNEYISLATVYRTLDMLKDLGLVAESHMGTTTTHYALKTHGDHHHAVCRICNQSIDLPPDFFDAVADRLHDEYNFVADVNHIVVLGWCQTCQDSAQQAETA